MPLKRSEVSADEHVMEFGAKANDDTTGECLVVVVVAKNTIQMRPDAIDVFDYAEGIVEPMKQPLLRVANLCS
jgi:hypothetical protein